MDTRIMENIDDVKEVALSCEKKINEFKVAIASYIINHFHSSSNPTNTKINATALLTSFYSYEGRIR